MINSAAQLSRFQKPSDIPPLRQSPFAPDAYDAQRCQWNEMLWKSQDELLRARDRQVEENIRMLHGQQWIVWSNLKGRYVNLAEHLPDDEKRWRHMPVLNRLLTWFVLQHARMTENPPVISWQPGPDRVDAMLAEVSDPLYKYIWRDVGMMEVLDRLIGWMIPSGRAYLKSRIDPTKGDPIPMRGPATLSLRGDDGAAISRDLPDVPFARNATSGLLEPAQRLEYDNDVGDYVPKAIPGMAPETLYEGGIEVDVVTCLEVRGEWGQHVPWYRKAWHMQKSLLTPLQVWEAFGIELEPDVTGQEAESTGVLWRLLHGAGLFGAAEGKRGSNQAAAQEFCTIYEAWHRPSRFPGTERTTESPGGRTLITAGSGKVLRDGIRPAPFRYTSPIHAFDYVGLPGRPQGTSPQEFMNGPIRTRNRLHAQMLQHATLAANPIRVTDRSQGLEEGQVPNIPGAEILVDRSRSKAPPIEYINPPQLGADVAQAADRLRAEVDQIGQIAGTEGTAPTEDSSGELVKELRFNADRPIAATMKRMVIGLGRVAEDWIALVPTIYDRDKVIRIVGEDSISRTITVYPMLFEQGSVNAEPEIESMLPEGRGERQERVFQFWKQGVWGDPRSVQATNMFLDLARFPHMSRAVRPGGVDRSTAEQNVGKLLQGAPAATINVYPWYDLSIHIYVLEQYLKSPEYERQTPVIQAECAAYWVKLRSAQSDAALMERTRQTDVETGAAFAQLSAAAALARATPPPPPGAAGAASGPIDQGPPDRGPSADLPSPQAA